MKKSILFSLVVLLFISCQTNNRTGAIVPEVITAETKHDTDDPAIWVNPADITQSLIIGTDKNSDGALYVYDLQGNIVNIVSDLKRPNNVDVAYGMKVGNSLLDISKVMIFKLLSLRRLCTKKCSSCDNKVFTLFIKLFVYKKIFLFRTYCCSNSCAGCVSEKL